MSFLSDAREAVRDRLLPDLERRLDQKIGSGDRFYVQRRLYQEGADKHDHFLGSFTDGEPAIILEEANLLDGNYVVLGRSGAGKSALALHLAIMACRQFLEDDNAPFPVFLELGTEVHPGDSQAVKDAFERASSGMMNAALQQHEAGVHLIVDALDEMLRYERRMSVSLDTVLLDIHRTGHCRILLTTRRSQWKQSGWRSGLLHSATAYHVDKVERYEYRQILVEDEWRPFHDACKSNGLYGLLDTPFDGFDLAFRFRNGETLPSSRRGHLDRRVNKRLRKNDGGGSASVSTSRLRELAGLLACVSSFGVNSSFTEGDAVDALRGTPLMDAGQEATETEVERLLASRLFKTTRSDSASHYAFNHVFYREYLAAEVLSGLSLRKQRQFLCVPLDGRERIAAVHRGIARMLAERNPSFREYLIQSDPPVAFFSSLSMLTEDERQNMLRRVFDWAVDQHLMPWTTVEGTGESFRDMLYGHRLSTPADFLRSYLQSHDEIARLWGAHAAGAWKNASVVQNELESVALNPDEHNDTRSRCVESLHYSCRRGALPAIRQLLFDDSDQVRGAAFGAYRKLTDPSLAEVFLLLQKPKQEPNLISILRPEVRAYGRSLSADEVYSAFHFLNALPHTSRKCANLDDRSATNQLHIFLLEGILSNPERIDFQHSSIMPVLYRTARRVNVRRQLTAFLANHPEVWRHFFLYVYDRCGRRGATGFASQSSIRILAESYSEDSLHLLPASHPVPTRGQRNFIREIRRKAGVSSVGSTDVRHLPIAVRKVSTPWLRSQIQVPDLDPLSVEKAVQAALSEGDPSSRVRRILEAVARLRNPHPHYLRDTTWAPEDDFERCAKDLGKWTEQLSSSTYQEVVQTLKAYCRNALSSNDPAQPWLQPIVRFLCEQENPFSADELESAFHRFSPYRRSKDAEHFLSRIREKSPATLRNVIRKAFSSGDGHVRFLIDYLAEHDDDFLLTEVRQHLEDGSWSPRDFHALLDYYLQFTSLEDATLALWRCYRLARLSWWGQNPIAKQECEFAHRLLLGYVFRPLLHLMNVPDQKAWSQFRYLLDEDFIPLKRRHIFKDVDIPTPRNLEHVQILMDWYVRIRRSIDQTGDPHYDKKLFADDIMSKVTGFGGVQVLRMLRRVQKDAPYEGARWLSRTIMDLESQILSGSVEQRPASSLLRMITKNRYHHVQSEKDLFEVTCEAVESLDDDFRSGKGVAGFWNTRIDPKTPKHEVECQNGLWPRLEDRLSAYGVTSVEEEVVNENYADLRIDYPRPHRSPLSTFIELKVARQGYGTAELVDPIENQLYDEHLRPSGCSHGIYVVLWFKDPGGYKYPSKWEDADALRSDLDAKAKDIESRYGVTISTYVLDLAVGYRSR